jgi:hypothetical protein
MTKMNKPIMDRPYKQIEAWAERQEELAEENFYGDTNSRYWMFLFLRAILGVLLLIARQIEHYGQRRQS